MEKITSANDCVGIFRAPSSRQGKLLYFPLNLLVACYMWSWLTKFDQWLNRMILEHVPHGIGCSILFRYSSPTMVFGEACFSTMFYLIKLSHYVTHLSKFVREMPYCNSIFFPSPLLVVSLVSSSFWSVWVWSYKVM